MNLAVPADYCVKLKESEKKVLRPDLGIEKKTKEQENWWWY